MKNDKPMKPSVLPPVLLVLSMLLAAGAGLTLVPFPGAGKPSMLGYRALCTFSPVSTAIMLFVAYSLNGYRLKLKDREKGGA